MALPNADDNEDDDDRDVKTIRSILPCEWSNKGSFAIILCLKFTGSNKFKIIS